MNKIEKIAHNHVASFGEVVPGYKFGYGELKEFICTYYFDFIFLNLDGNISEEPPVAGGPCGFTIDKKTFEIENLTFADLGMLEQNERELNDIYHKIKNIKENNSSLNWLKSTFNLNSKQLLKIKKVIDNTEFEKETALEQINQIIKTTTNNI
ncbi:hypothetical protein [Kordia sp.]|uniref:hypothetical protein n=1 Tax=Kordia sp. TaxID=1965332 RepID=UPI003D6B63A7